MCSRNGDSELTLAIQPKISRTRLLFSRQMRAAYFFGGLMIVLALKDIVEWLAGSKQGPQTILTVVITLLVEALCVLHFQDLKSRARIAIDERGIRVKSLFRPSIELLWSDVQRVNNLGPLGLQIVTVRRHLTVVPQWYENENEIREAINRLWGMRSFSIPSSNNTTTP